MQCQAMMHASVMVGGCRAWIAQKQCSKEAVNKVTIYDLKDVAPIKTFNERIGYYCSIHTRQHQRRPNCWYPSWYKHPIIEKLSEAKNETITL